MSCEELEKALAERAVTEVEKVAIAGKGGRSRKRKGPGGASAPEPNANVVRIGKVRVKEDRDTGKVKRGILSKGSRRVLRR